MGTPETVGVIGNGPHAGLAHGREELDRGVPAAHGIVEQANLDPAPRSLRERIGEATAGPIVVEDIHLQGDPAAGSVDGLQPGWESLAAVA